MRRKFKSSFRKSRQMIDDEGDENDSIRLQHLGTRFSAENTSVAREQQWDGMQQHTRTSSVHVGYQ